MTAKELRIRVGKVFHSRAIGWIAGAALLLACRSEAVSATAVYVVTQGGLLYRSTDAAATWQQVPIPGVPSGTFTTWLGIDPAGNINLTLAQASVSKARPGDPPLLRALFRSVDGGQSWSQTTLPVTVETHVIVDPTAPNSFYGITNQGVVHSTDSGATFSDATLKLAASAVGADPQQPGVVYTGAVGQDRSYTVYKSADYGSTWTSLGSPAGKTVAWTVSEFAVDPQNSSVVYLVGAGTCATGVTNCGLYRSADGGKTWLAVNIAGSFNNIVFDSKSGAIYAGGANRTGQVVKSADGGKTWTSFATGLPGYAVVAYPDPNVSSTLYAAPASGGVSPGGVWVSTNSGATWKLSPVAPQTAPNDGILAMGVAAGTPAPRPAVSVTSTVSAASLQPGPVAAESIVIATGTHIATGPATADYDQPLSTLLGTTINVTDSAGVTRPAVIFKVSATQATYQIPAGTAAGPANVTITAGDGVTGTVQVQVAAVAPGVYSLNSGGLAKAYVLRVSNGNQFVEDVYDIDATGAVIARPITVSNGDQVYLFVYGTGFRAAGGDISATVGGVTAPVLYAGPQGVQPGLDQFNILIPPEVATGGPLVVPIVLTAASQTANTVNVTVQ